MTTQQRRLATTGAVIAALILIAVGTYFFADGRARERPGKGAAKASAAVIVSTAVVEPRSLEVYEEVIGNLENVIDPTIGAEVAGRVTRVHGFTGKRLKSGELLAEIDAADFEIQSRADQAEIARLGNLLRQQERVVERQQKLVTQGFISQNALDDAVTQRNALREQLNSARARSDGTRRSLTKTRVVAPIDGEIETQIVAVGDYVKVGDPLFRMVGVHRMRARLPLPESAAARLRPGLKVELTFPSSQRMIAARIDEIKPTIGAANRALEAIVNFHNDDPLLRGGGSVNARIVVATRENALMLPEESVVLRPAGKVVYVIREGRAEQRVVQTGLKQDGFYEIVAGIGPGETVAVDGAGFLTNGAAVSLPRAKPPAAGTPPGRSG